MTLSTAYAARSAEQSPKYAAVLCRIAWSEGLRVVPFAEISTQKREHFSNATAESATTAKHYDLQTELHAFAEAQDYIG